jgi:hypothetical protein
VGREDVVEVSCPGLHCPGCSEGQSLAILGGVVIGLVLADRMVQWVAERIWWIGGMLAVAVAVAVAASMALEAWNDRRGARFAARHGILSRADVIMPEPVRAVVVESAPARRELEPRAIHLHFHGLPDTEQAAVIRQALPPEQPRDGHGEHIAG